MKDFLKRVLPLGLRRWLRNRQRSVKLVLSPLFRIRDFGPLRRVTPMSREFGYDRGRPVGRYYIERFLSRHAEDVRGHVLEINDDTYTRRFGGSRVTCSDVLHPVAGNPQATLVADLTSAESIPADRFDCIICTQTLLVIYDVQAAIRTLHRILRPGGVLLVTVPGVSHQISRHDMDRWGDYWRFTTLSARRLFEEAFPPGSVQVEADGNVLSAVAFLHGLATEEFLPEELDHRDPDYEVSISIRAIKPIPCG